MSPDITKCLLGLGGGARITPVENHQSRGTVTFSHKDGALIWALGLEKPQLSSVPGRQRPPPRPALQRR